MSTTEARRATSLPLWELDAWRERYGIVAGITGRGDDAEPFDLGLWTDQPVGAVMRRWRAFRAHHAAAFPAMVLAHQVHGADVLVHGAQPPGWRIVEGADGHVTGRAGILLLVTVADCIPVYLAAPRHRAVALLHAGWRGTAAGILGRGVALLRECTGADAADVACHLGVGISGPCYEVGREVMDGVGEPAPGDGPWHLDLRAVLTRQARALSLAEVTASEHCSARDGQHFFSHRRSRGADGRMVAYLGLPAS